MCWKLLDCSSRMASGWSFGFRFELHILYVLISTNPESSFPLVRLKRSSLYILLQASANKILGLSFLARFQGFSTNPLSPTKSLWTPDQVLNLGREEPPLGKVCTESEDHQFRNSVSEPFQIKLPSASSKHALSCG